MASGKAEDFRVIMDADNARLVAQMDRAATAMQRFETRATASMRRFDGMMAAVATRVAAGLASLIGAFSVNAILKGAETAIDAMHRIKDAAEASGLSTDLFQGLQFAAVQAGTPMQELEQALRAFAKGMGEAKNAQGQLYSGMKEFNPELLRMLLATRSQEQALKLLADRMAATDDATKRAALASVAFGDSGVKIAKLFADGGGAIDGFVAKARAMGFIIDEHMLKRAAEIDDKFKIASAVIDRQFKLVLIELAPTIVDTAELIGRLVRGLNAMTDAFRDVEQLSAAGIARRMDSLRVTLGKAVDDYNATMQRLDDMKAGNFVERMWPTGMLEASRDRAKAVVDATNAELLQLQQRLDAMTAPKPEPQRDPSLGRAFVEETRQAEQQMRDLYAKALDAAGRATDAVLVEYQKELNGIKELKRKTLLTEDEFQAARQRLAYVSADKILKATETEWAKLRQVTDSVANSMGQAFDKFVETGKFSMRDFTASALKDLAKLAFRMFVLQSLFGQSGKGFGLFGDMVGLPAGNAVGQGWGTSTFPAFAGGGRPPVDRPSIVGEEGPELFVPDRPGRIIPAAATRALMAPGAAPQPGGELVVTIAPSSEFHATVDNRANAAVARAAPAIAGSTLDAARKSLPGWVQGMQKRGTV